MPVSSSTEHWIKPDALTINLNHFGDPDYLQVSVLAGAVVMAFKQDVIGYNAAHNYRTWPLDAANTYLETTSAYNVYARLTRSEVNARALVIYDTVLRDIEGREITYIVDSETDEEVEVLGDANPDYFFVFLGQISASVNENGGDVLREWLSEFRFGNLNTNQYQNEEAGGEWSKMFRLNKVTDFIEVLKTISSAIFKKLSIKRGETEKVITDIKRSTDSDEDVPVNDENIPTTLYVQTSTEKKYLRKDKDDRTPFKLNVGDKLTAEKGIQIGKSFIPGILTGSGGFIDEYANAELESLILRRFLEVPELRYNRVQVTLGDKWNAAGAGIIERVVQDSDTTGTIFLKLEEGEYGAIAVDDICMGIFHSEVASENATEDYDDSRGNFQFAGFYTCYFRITGITGKDNKQFTYSMRPTSDRWKLNYHPREAMHFVCYGNFTNTDRQTSAYTTRTYTRLLKNQNDWEISSKNIAMQWGDMGNMSIHGMDMKGYSIYTTNIYNKGIIKQVKDNGEDILTANDRGAWISGTTYDYYDRVSYNGSLWLCVNENGTNSEPTKTNSDWLLQVASGDSLTAGGRFSSSNTPYSPNSIVDFADKAWITTDTVSDAPYPIWTDHNGNRLMFSDGGFCLVNDSAVNAGWQVLLDTGNLKDGENGKSLIVQWSADGVNWHDEFTTGDIYMRQKVGEDAVWSGAIRIAGEKGAAGKNGEYTEYEFAVNDSVDTAPTSGWADTPPTVGKGQYLWMRMRIVQGDGTAGNWSVPVRIGGEKGDSVEFVGRFYTGLNVPYLGIVQMGDANWAAKKATTNPPLWCWTDESGNRLQFSDGGFIITGEENTEYELMVANGKDGSDGNEYEYIFINTTTDKQPSTPSTKQVDDYVPSGWHDDPAGVSSDVPYEWVSQRRKKDGLWGEFSTPAMWSSFSILSFKATAFIRTNDTPSTPTGGSYDSPVPTSTPKWYDGIPSGEEILWASTRVFTKNGTGIQESSWSTPRQMTDTSSFEVIYHTSETEPTPPTNYPTTTGAWTPNNGWTDDPSESSVWMATATKANGAWGAWKVSKIKGEKGEDGNSYEYVYLLTRTSAKPDTPVGENMDAWTPQGGWTNLPSGVTDVYRYEWVSQRQKTNGTWGGYSTPTIWAMFGEGKQGIQGCVIRDSEWAEGVEYRNDEDLTEGTRYIDVVLVRDENAATGWVAYKCIQTHRSTYKTKPYHSLYWEEFGTNTTAIFTSLIVAKNAKIKFLQGNQLLIQKNDGTVTGGLSGSEEGRKVRFWAGAETPDDAPFRVTEDGDAHVSGTVTVGVMKYKTIRANGNTVSMEGYTLAYGGGIYTMPTPNEFTQVYGLCHWFSRTARTFRFKTTGNCAFVKKGSDDYSSTYVQSVDLDSNNLYKFTCVPDDWGDYDYVWIISIDNMI